MLFVFKRELTLWAVCGTRPREGLQRPERLRSERLTELVICRELTAHKTFCGASQSCTAVQPICILVWGISAVLCGSGTC